MMMRIYLGTIFAIFCVTHAHALGSKAHAKETLVFQGKVVLNPDLSAHINPRYEGIVTKVYVQEGDKIKKGSRLATIERNVGMSVYHIVSPISGVVLHRDLSPGEFVTSEREAFSLANLDSLWVKFDVHPKDISHFKEKNSIQIHSRISKNTVEGDLFYISPTVIEQTRTVTVYSRLDNMSRSWLPYQLVDGSFPIDHHHDGASHE